MNPNHQRTLMLVLIAIFIIILGIFVFKELSMQQQMIDVLGTCNYEEICDVCINERLYGIPKFS